MEALREYLLHNIYIVANDMIDGFGKNNINREAGLCFFSEEL
ncbi:hypothetical protein [Pantoea phytobeneficialis]|uniref:Uncharacterized protein n=1 Tax=Pantoea phytobeneficialis TaxID=2052056 RepID=A0ABT8XVE8_9GAMM|nr:hypothetical protein [Pantoea phytobeneficialis]MDO6407401.1 hypothetical protein [Pantoea phytobeneficialis]